MISELTAWLDSGVTHGAVITASATVVVFFATRLVDIAAHRLAQQKARKRTIVGLYQEVMDNLDKLGRFPADESARNAFKNKIRGNVTFRPLFVVQESTKFYDLSAATLPTFTPRRCLR